ncbi:hypothetical protein AAG906_021279 [Vitis piasezkii]
MDASSSALFNTTYGLEGFLTGDRVHPPAMVVDAKDPQVFVENLDFLYWTRMDQFLVTWLIGSISEAMLGHVIRCTSAVILYILFGLGPEYEFVVVNITSKDHITLQCVMFMLQNHEQRIESCESTTQVDVNGVNAHYAANENSFNSGYNRGNDNYRGRPRGSRGGGGGRNQSKNKSICQVCRKRGHIALKCYHRFDLSYQGQEAAANANLANTSSTTYTNPQAYMAAPSSSDPNNNSWFLDNGATHHITADNSNLASKNDYNDKEKLDLITGATLLKGVHDHGLYHLELSPIRTTQAFLAYSSQPGSCSSCFYNKTASCHSSMACNVLFPNKSHDSCNNSVVQDSPVKSLWHNRLGHPSVSFSIKSYILCQSHHLLIRCFNLFFHSVKTNKPLQLIHLDVWGPSLNIFIEGPPSVFFLVIALLIKGFASLPSCPTTGTTVPIVDNITRSKSGIYKPKVYIVVVALPDHFQEPSSVRQALQLPHRKTKMEVEYSALVRNGFVSSTHPTHACKLIKSLYGLKQAPRAWFVQLRSALVSWRFQHSISNNSLFHSRKNGHLVLVLAYVDDTLITGDSSALIHSVIQALTSRFALKTLGSISYFLRFEAFRDNSGLYLNQVKYIFDLLVKKNMVHAKLSSTPMALGQKLALEDNAHFPNAPTQHHWSACKRLLRYVSGTRTLGLSFRPTTRFTLEGFSDADWACNVDDRRSTTGYCVFLGGNLVTWSSRKQQVIARSNTKSKYQALASVTMELIWIKSLLDELQFPLQHCPIAWCDNLGVHALAHNPVYHSRTKHIEVDVHFIRE